MDNYAQLRYLASVHKITVLMDDEGFSRLDSYCEQNGFKKSPLIVRLVRQHLDREGFKAQTELRFVGGHDDRSSASGAERTG